MNHLIFDLDDTLYSAQNGLWAELAKRIDRFLIERIGVAESQVSERRRAYYEAHGTTMAGMLHDGVAFDPYEFLDFVHDVDYGRYLSRDERLERMLAALPVPKSIFTNADQKHAEQVLAHLGVRAHFEFIVDITAVGFVNKPKRAAFDKMLALLAVQPEHCVFIEDSEKNLAAARALGMTTVLVKAGAAPPQRFDFHVEDIYAVGPLIKSLMDK